MLKTLNQTAVGLALVAALTAGALVIPATAAAEEVKKANASVRTVQVHHHTIDLPVPYDKLTSNIEKMLGRFDPVDTYIAITERQRGTERLQASQGEEGLMLFSSNDHGVLWALLGEKPRKAIRYYLGNPLFAIRMTQKNLGAALYAPLTVVVYQIDANTTRVEYDQPSTLFGQFSEPAIDQVGKALDLKLRNLIFRAAGLPTDL